MAVLVMRLSHIYSQIARTQAGCFSFSACWAPLLACGRAV